MSQASLARKAGVSLSLLTKIETGIRTLTQPVAADLATAMGTTLDHILGSAPVERDDANALDELRATIRRFDLPNDSVITPKAIRDDLRELVRLRGSADLSGVLARLPNLLARSTDHAHSSGTPSAWGLVADVYSSVYWLAARHRWMDLADLAVVKQQLAAERATAVAAAVASRDAAGAFLNSGDFQSGLAIVERSIVRTEASTTGRDRAFALGILHLRGLTLAGRLGDTAEAARHRAAAWRLAQEFPQDVDEHGLHFGPENTATHDVATFVDLERHRDALRIASDLSKQRLVVPATRIAPLHLNVSRARLAMRDRDGALESLRQAWDAAPQMAKVHPTSQELLRVLISLHRRSNPTLTSLAKRARLAV
ncbi:hypothetical protein GCM10022247_33390 [Allokutzneria multivorans]|uniref:HTH cro/C1-type domain-containing protein n=2 Tax=Allokutzneria multivorans TaxID=1142134 RepID=A0ABP7S903_9PSEU